MCVRRRGLLALRDTLSPQEYVQRGSRRQRSAEQIEVQEIEGDIEAGSFIETLLEAGAEFHWLKRKRSNGKLDGVTLEVAVTAADG